MSSTYTERVTITRSQLIDLDDLCHGIVVHGGQEDACSKPANAVVYDAESARLWPACAWHANRYGGALDLCDIRTALRDGAAWFEREVAYP